MARFTSVAPQTVGALQNVLFSDNCASGNCSILHRQGSGIVTLRGLTNQCRARFSVTVGGNITIPEGGTVESISVAIAIGGEADQSTIMISTPAAVGDLGNVSATTYVDVPAGCCTQVSLKNTSTQPITIQNAHLIVERTA